MKERAGSNVIEHSYNDLRDGSLQRVSFLRKIAGKRIHAAVTGPTCYSYLVSYFGTVMSNIACLANNPSDI